MSARKDFRLQDWVKDEMQTVKNICFIDLFELNFWTVCIMCCLIAFMFSHRVYNQVLGFRDDDVASVSVSILFLRISFLEVNYLIQFGIHELRRT